MMRKYTYRFCAVLLALCTILSISASAIDTKASEQISNYEMDVTPIGNGQLNIHFTIQGTNRMSRIGARSIVIYEQPGVTWLKAASYDQYDEGMSATNAYIHGNSIYFNGTPGVLYQIVVTLFAQDSSGSDSRTQTFYVRAT